MDSQVLHLFYALFNFYNYKLAFIRALNCVTFEGLYFSVTAVLVFPFALRGDSGALNGIMA